MAQNRAPDHCTNVTSQTSQDPATIWLTIPFVGDLTTQLTKKLKHKLRRSLVDPNVDIRIKQKTTKLCFFTSTRDKTPPLCKSDVVYEFTCPGCNCSYIGKTNRTLFTRTQEHALTDKESAIYKHLRQCDNIQHIQGLYNLPDIFSNKTGPPSTTTKEFFTETVRSNTKIIDSDDNLEPPSIQRGLSHKTFIAILEQWLEGQQRTLLILMTVFLFLFCTYFILTCLLMLIYHPFSI